MKSVDQMRRMSLLGMFLLFILPLVSCEKGGEVIGPIPIPKPDPVFNADGGFIITYGMLNRRYNEISFPGTHNSAANNTIGACENQHQHVWEQLQNGIRYIELDVNDVLNTCHGSCHFVYSINQYFNDIKNYVAAHPNQVVTVRISDLCTGLGATESYGRINGRLENTGLEDYIYNWDPKMPKDDPRRCYVPDPWPTLREMVESGKNVMFIHHRKTHHDIVDEGSYKGLAYGDDRLFWFYEAYYLEDLCKLTPVWSTPRDRQKDGPNRLLLLECDPDGGASAGSQLSARVNNDGRKLYQLAKYQEAEVVPDKRAVNFITVDYFGASSAGPLPINVVDACNRLNFERFGIDWKSSVGFWALYPHEGDDSRIEVTGQSAALTAEVNELIDSFKSEASVDGYEEDGSIVSTGCDAGPSTWRRLPEWALDGDFFTRWCGADGRASHGWGIDLGGRKAVDEIAIAWEIPNYRPGYTVYASNDDSKFANGISEAELLDDAGWVVVASGAESSGRVLLWDQKQFQDIGIHEWRYVKIRIGHSDVNPSFYEVRLYGPAK